MKEIPFFAFCLLATAVGCTSSAPKAATAACGECGAGSCAEMAAAPSTQPAGTLTAVEINELLRMRREEKLAHDVYVTLGQKYPLRPFQNIPRSEQMHQRMVEGQLDRHGIADPVRGLPVGKFDEPTFQQLFDRLVEKGQASEVAALKVGAEIEELDIKDLRAAAGKSQNAELLAVYANLERASGNHLRAFMRNTTARGGTYAAQHLTQAEFDQIVAGSAPSAGMGMN